VTVPAHNFYRVDFLIVAIRTFKVFFNPLRKTLQMEPMATGSLHLILSREANRALDFLIVNDVMAAILIVIFQNKLNVIVLGLINISFGPGQIRQIRVNFSLTFIIPILSDSFAATNTNSDHNEE